MNRAKPSRIAITLALFAVVFSVLTTCSYTQKSATADEPVHLTTGYCMLKLGDYRIHPESPPLLRMWAALPLLLRKDVALDTSSPYWAKADQWNFSREFLYAQNDADRLLYPARFMIVMLGIVLGVLLFCWANEWYGFWPAVVTLALYCLEPNVLAHSSVVTTDMGVTCFIFGAVYFLWRTTQLCTAGTLAGLTMFFALAQISKSSALLLGPITAALLLIHACRKHPWRIRFRSAHELASRRSKIAGALMIIGLLVACTYVAVWGVYRFRYAPSAASFNPFCFSADPRIQQRAPILAAAVNWVDAHRLLPNAFTEGFLLEQARGQQWPSYLAGHISMSGWWYYFPVAFLIKTPIVLLLLFAAGAVLCVVRREHFLDKELFAVLPLAAGFVASTMPHMDIGLRHILPLYPLAILLAGRVIAELQAHGRKSLLLAVPVLAAAELATAYPHTLAFFNGFVGGPRNGKTLLVESNLDWGQDLKPLKRWMDSHGVRHINLGYFGTADPAYYGIQYTRLPTAFIPLDQTQPPSLPGYVAVSVTNLRGVYLPDRAREFYRPLLEREPAAIIGHSIYVYWVEGKWW